MDTALLIIDLQSGNFIDTNPIVNGKELLSKTGKLIPKAQINKVPIIYIQNNGSTGDPDEYDTPGWEIHSSLAPVEGDIKIQKSTPDAFHETNLQEVLNSKSIKK